MGYMSNKNFGIILIAAMISIVGLISTGIAVTDTGSATATVSSTTFVNFTTETVAWGTGTVTEGKTSCTLNTTGTTTNCASFTAVSSPLVLENIGNTNVTIELASNVAAAAYIGGTSPSFQWKLSEGETNSCLGNTGVNCNTTDTGALTDTSLTNVNATSPGTTVCPCFLAKDATDLLNIDLQVVIPSDAPSGAKSATLTATATAL